MIRILVIENEKAHRRLFEEILNSVEEWDITAVANTAEAEEILAREAIDLIVLDHLLPMKLGAEWFREYLKRQPNGIREIPVLFISVVAMNPDIKSLDDEPNTIVMPKPLNRSDLIDAARKLLKAKGKNRH